MKRLSIITAVDIVTSALLMISYLYASLHSERFDTSMQFNSINVLVSIIGTGIGVKKKLYGLAFRQLFFAVVSGYNLWNLFF